MAEDSHDTVAPDRTAVDEIAAALERELLGGDRVFDRGQVADHAGVAEDKARTLWRALGFAEVGDDVVAFTDRDVWALETVERLGREGWLDDAAQVAMTRALGQSLSRLADWQLSAASSMSDPDTSDDRAMERASQLVPVVEELMGYVWRRHLAAAVGRSLLGGDAATARLTVGFADLVGFTSLTRDIDEAGLAALVESFESTAADLVADGNGRVVKTVGDEVMFVADAPRDAAEIGLALSDAVAADDSLPDLRVGLASGQVVARMGDLYGEPVNIAARLTSIARPGSVLADRVLADLLREDDDFVVHRAPPRPVRGYSVLHPYRLRRADPPA